MHTVIETPAYLKAASDAGMSEAEQETVVTILAREPKAGDRMEGTGGCRKLRIAGRGKGKSGVITFFGGDEVPLFLITVFGKGEPANLNQKERNELRKFTRTLVASLGSNVKKLRSGQ
jgi:hypothetical protein